MIVLAIIGYLVAGFITAVVVQKVEGGYSEPWELGIAFIAWPIYLVVMGGFGLIFGIGIVIDWVAEGGFKDLYDKLKEMQRDD